LKPEMKGDFKNVTFFQRDFDRSFPRKPARIFINPSSDPIWWGANETQSICGKILAHPQHAFILLTKNEAVYDWWKPTFGKLKNLWLGITVNTAVEMEKQGILKGFKNITFLSLEPIREEIPIESFDPNAIDWLIIGGQSGPGEKFYPSGTWFRRLTMWCDEHEIPLFVKDNFQYEHKLTGRIAKSTKRYEWPEVKP
jgi:Bacteriophage protein gp37